MDPAARPIVAVHTPKTAGTTLKHHFEQAFDKSEILFDYADDPADPGTAWNLDPESFAQQPITSIAPHRVVYGHFAARKYRLLTDAFWLTFLRHPIDNVVSIYRFWSKHDRNTWESPLFRYTRDRDLSLEQFASLPLIRFLYSEVYFGDFDVGGFAFVGDYANFDEELARLGMTLGVEFDRDVHLNKTSPDRETTDRHGLTRPEYDALARLLRQDIEFYDAYRGR